MGEGNAERPHAEHVGDIEGNDPGDGLFEREAELAALSAALAAARSGTGGLVVFEGPAGIGKSRLLAEARAMADTLGMAVLSARGIDLERDAPFGVAADLFASVLQAGGPGKAEPATERSPRLAIVEDTAFAEVDLPVRQRFARHVDTLIAHGATVHALGADLPWSELANAHRTIMLREIATVHASRRRAEPEHYSPTLNAAITEGLAISDVA